LSDNRQRWLESGVCQKHESWKNKRDTFFNGRDIFFLFMGDSGIEICRRVNGGLVYSDTRMGY
jgi:hypothetical protein